ncbi:carbamoylphosphate synthase large subunit [Kitasatospora terrestris]
MPDPPTPAPSPAVPGTFTARLKNALVGDPEARFVHLNNFEVERFWAEGEPGLPGAGMSFAPATVNRIEEVGLCLAAQGDFVVLKEMPDPGYAAYLSNLGLLAATVLTVDGNNPSRTVTQDALDSPRLLETLRALNDGRTYLAPMGVSVLEERLAAASGLPLAGAGSAVARQVNGKIYSRDLVDALGLTPVPGTVCRTVRELARALEEAFADPSARLVVKESLGVSGRGMVVLDGSQRGERLIRMISRRSSTDDRLPVVVEHWLEKRADLNYQFLVGRDGGTAFETVKLALTQNGVHRGHVFPAGLGPQDTAVLENAAERIGEALHASGFHGLVGVDALLGADGVLYPCLEINARFNMATFQNRIAEELIPPGAHVLATQLELRPTRTVGFEEVRSALDGLLLDSKEHVRGGARGVLINNFATLNAALLADDQQYGRLYALVVGDDEADTLRRLARLEDVMQGLVTP